MKLLQHLLSNGFVQTQGGTISTMGNLHHIYKHPDGREVYWGLNQVNKPETLVYPRPTIFVCGKNVTHLDDYMNRVLQRYEPSEIYHYMFHQDEPLILTDTIC